MFVLKNGWELWNNKVSNFCLQLIDNQLFCKFIIYNL
jgi:hypothetical protein